MVNEMLEGMGSGSLGSGFVVAKLMDYIVPYDWTIQGKQMKTQRSLERERMSFQMEQQDRMMRFQERMEERKEEFQKYILERQLEANFDLATFQMKANRQIQIEMAQKHAENAIQLQLHQKALDTFPLNVSPLVLINNQRQQTGVLLDFSDGDTKKLPPIEVVCEEVLEANRHPNALNIFVAPVYIDSRIKNRKVLSDQIWDAIYQQIESFFTLCYNRVSDHPVIIYPTAWNDRLNPGMHATETLHFFLKDLPCVVIEPRFDGSMFKMIFSAWSIGYNTTHHRTEMSFPVNIDAEIALAAYERSQKALKAIEEIEKTMDAKALGFETIARNCKNNIDLFEALHLEERMREGRMEEIEALGIYNIFKVDPAQDFTKLSFSLSQQIGFNLAILSDIHHLLTYNRTPILPALIKRHFPEQYGDMNLRKMLLDEYQKAYKMLRKENANVKNIREIHNIQLILLKHQLNLIDDTQLKDELTNVMWRYDQKHFGLNLSTMSDAILRPEWKSDDIPLLEKLMEIEEIANNRDLYRRIDMIIYNMKVQIGKNEKNAIAKVLRQSG